MPPKEERHGIWIRCKNCLEGQVWASWKPLPEYACPICHQKAGYENCGKFEKRGQFPLVDGVIGLITITPDYTITHEPTGHKKVQRNDA